MSSHGHSPTTPPTKDGKRLLREVLPPQGPRFERVVADERRGVKAVVIKVNRAAWRAMRILAIGPVAVAELEKSARAAGLLREHQKITDAKRFKTAKAKLNILSRRRGFGRDGMWYWSLPTQSSGGVVQTQVDTPAQIPAMLA